jgi:CheY-like chemotaxis protein
MGAEGDGRKRVLIVDDNVDLLDVLSETIGQLGAEACAVASVAALIARRESALTCHLAILDVNLGENVPSGVDACRWLRKQGFGGAIVFLTAHAARHPLVVAAAALPDTRILRKPITIEQLDELLSLLR